MSQSSLFLVLGATGGTGKHYVAQCLKDGHRVRALIRNPSKLPTTDEERIEVVKGSITDEVNTDDLVKGVDYVVAMLGDKELQKTTPICTNFVKKLVPSMRKHGVKRFMYQAGGLSKPYGGELSTVLWIVRNTLARGFDGQHKDNESVMEYLATEAKDIEWMVHRAGIGSDGTSKGTLQRSSTDFSIGTHVDCANFNYRTIMDPEAVHTTHLSHYVKG